ncbi:hypothetical protein RF55_15006, partial [Lasius niger]
MAGQDRGEQRGKKEEVNGNKRRKKGVGRGRRGWEKR